MFGMGLWEYATVEYETMTMYYMPGVQSYKGCSKGPTKLRRIWGLGDRCGGLRGTGVPDYRLRVIVLRATARRSSAVIVMIAGSRCSSHIAWQC